MENVLEWTCASSISVTEWTSRTKGAYSLPYITAPHLAVSELVDIKTNETNNKKERKRPR